MPATQPRLITITFSHYCEKARWALEYRKIAFTEEAHLPTFHALPAFRSSRQRMVPVLVEGNTAIPDSTAILRWADAQRSAGPRLYPDALADEILALEERFDRNLGPASRRWAYGFILRERELLLKIAEQGAPPWQHRTLPYIFPFARWLMRKSMRIDDAGIARSRQKLDRVFDDVAALLSDGRRYLCGDQLSAADITFAALAAPALMPAAYGSPLPPIRELPAKPRTEIAAYRAHAAGAFALRIYAEERTPSDAP